MFPLPDIAIGAVVAALIAALVSFLGLIISKEQKISDFRQAWIDSLRADIAAVVAHANAIHGAASAEFDTPAKSWEAAREDFVGINQATANIRLRLNSKEKESQDVLKSIEDLEAHLLPGVLDYKVLDVIERQLVADAQVLLKKEWLRVRYGEPVFRTAKALLGLIMLSSTFFILYYLIPAASNSPVNLHFSHKVPQLP